MGNFIANNSCFITERHCMKISNILLSIALVFQVGSIRSMDKGMADTFRRWDAAREAERIKSNAEAFERLQRWEAERAAEEAKRRGANMWEQQRAASEVAQEVERRNPACLGPSGLDVTRRK